MQTSHSESSSSKESVLLDKFQAISTRSGTKQSPKISVKGDYDQFARKPRKDTNKGRDRALFTTEKQIQAKKEERATQCVQDDTKKTNLSALEQDLNDALGARKQAENGEKVAFSSAAQSSGVHVTNFPKDGDKERMTSLSRLDSLPQRKQSHIELLRQLRQEANESKASVSPYRLRESLESWENPLAAPAFGSPTPRRKTFTHGGKNDLFAMSRISKKYMIGYIRAAEKAREKNVISSMVVRPILPPIKHAKRREEAENNGKVDVTLCHTDAPILAVTSNDRTVRFEHDGRSVPEKFQWKNTADMTYHFQRGSRLRQGQSKYVYRPLARNFPAVTDPPREVVNEWGEIEEDFDRVIRWKSKVRYCGKPVMHKRVMSPTLGEEAIKRKMTDRLPTRQTHQSWPEPGDLDADVFDHSESWRRGANSNQEPASHGEFLTSIRSKATGIANVHLNAALFYPQHLPFPQIPLKKRRPMWQRM